MIMNKKDLQFYLEADRKSLGINHGRPYLLGDEIWRFQIALRKYEFRINSRRSPLDRPLRMLARIRYHVWSLLLGFSIPPNVFGPGLSIAHRGTIIVFPGTKVGKNCRLHACVNIGVAAGTTDQVPVIGDNVYVGPGAKLFGKISIADGVAIGANAVVNKSCTEASSTLGGVPARVLSRKGSKGLLLRGTDLVVSS